MALPNFDMEDFEEALDNIELLISDVIDEGMASSKDMLKYFHAKDKLGELYRELEDLKY